MTGSYWDWLFLTAGSCLLVYNLAAPFVTEPTEGNVVFAAFWAWALTRQVHRMSEAHRG